jgi:hypothetical protein
MLEYAKLPNSFTHESILCANYIYNRSVCKYTNQKTPFQLFYGKTPDVSHFRIFGSKVYYHVHKDQRKGNYNLRGKVGRMIGYSENSNTYRIWTGISIITSKDVVFDEDSFQFQYTNEALETEFSNLNIEDEENDSIFISVPVSLNNQEEMQQTPALDTTAAPQTVPMTPNNTNRSEEMPSGVPIASILNETDAYNSSTGQPFAFCALFCQP